MGVYLLLSQVLLGSFHQWQQPGVLQKTLDTVCQESCAIP